MVITDKQQISDMIMREVVMKHGNINLDLDDYKTCQKVGEEKFASVIYAEHVVDAIKQMKAEMAEYNINDMKAAILYVQGDDLDFTENLSLFEFIDSLPDGVTLKWGIGALDDKDHKLRLFMFAFC